LPDESTELIPGSPAKVALLTARAQAGRQLHHPLDRHLDGGWDVDLAVDLDSLPWRSARYLVPHPCAP
jgi:hypothetical protein